MDFIFRLGFVLLHRLDGREALVALFERALDLARHCSYRIGLSRGVLYLHRRRTHQSEFQRLAPGVKIRISSWKRDLCRQLLEPNVAIARKVARQALCAVATIL